MNMSRIGRRLAVSGVATAIAAAGLVGTTGVAADAATADGNYTCTVLGTPMTFPVHVDAPVLPPTANAGTNIPAGLLQAATSVTIPAAVAGQLGAAGVTGGTVSDFGMLVGDTLAPAPLTFDGFTPGAAGALVASTTAKNTPFALPKPGTYDITLPKSFTFVPTANGVALPINIPCSTDTASKLSSIRLDINGSTTAVKAPAKAKKSAGAKVTSTVASVNALTPVPTGKVVAKMGKKTVGTGTLNSSGKAVMKLTKLPVGKDKITVSYLGDAFYSASKAAPVTIKVVK